GWQRSRLRPLCPFFGPRFFPGAVSRFGGVTPLGGTEEFCGVLPEEPRERSRSICAAWLAITVACSCTCNSRRATSASNSAMRRRSCSTVGSGGVGTCTPLLNHDGGPAPHLSRWVRQPE